MKNFYEFYRQIKEFTGAPTPGAPTPGAPAAPGAVAGRPAPGVAPGAAIGPGGMASGSPKLSFEDAAAFKQMEAELQHMMGDDISQSNFLPQLQKFITNPKFKEFMTSGSPEEKVDTEKKTLPATKVFPTQMEIFAEKSLNNGLDNTKFGNLDDFLKGKAKLGDVICCEVGSTVYIIDGHHRWSQIFCWNPQASVNCLVVKNLPSYLQGLKLGHLATAFMGQKTTNDETGSNILQFTQDRLRTYVVDNLNEDAALPVFQANYWCEPSAEVMDQKNQVADRLWVNVQDLQKHSQGTEPRAVMPQVIKDPLEKEIIRKEHLFLSGVITAEQYYR